MLKRGYSLWNIFKSQILTSIGCLIGAIVGVNLSEEIQETMMIFVAAGFLNLCLSSIYPEIKKIIEKKRSFITILGNLIFIYIGIVIIKNLED